MRRRLLDVLSRLAASAPASCSSSAGAAIVAVSPCRVASGALASTSAEAWKPAEALKIARQSRAFASSSQPQTPPPPPPAAPATHAPPCWSCGQHAGTARPSLVCGSCRAVQPLELVFGGGEPEASPSAPRASSPGGGGGAALPPDPFSLLGLPRSFDVDPKALEASYRALQAKLHPDKHHRRPSAPPSDRDRASLAAADASAAVNAAVALLRCPLARARFLLDGTRPDRDDDGAIGGSREVFGDPELLMEVMEAREEVEEAAAAAAASRRGRESSGDGDGSSGSDTSPCPLALLRAKHERAADALSHGLSRAFASGDLDEARRLAVRLRYVTRILQAVEEKM